MQPQSESSSRPLLPRNKSFQGDQVYDNSFVTFDIGTGQLDPFNACVPAYLSLDILDYVWSINFAGATHKAYLQRGADIRSRDRTLRLSYKTNAIKELNREIQGLQGVAYDELLLAIITMTAHGSGEQLDQPSQEEILSTLESVQSFQYFGRMR
ncbi:hypothetical protein CLCR_00945 [Cladophialophora carrionii]|uniref:Uncharacterized protein n=1 Tax=Cladophialophora carrionii TaxID=86049 RepID=A0A1C1D1G6_9EURO|nr:hypothetical protein CLCR_00945 [Cladophialophora carrionii]